MQDIILYIAAGQVLSEIRDSANARSSTAPSFALGVKVRFLLRLFKDIDTLDPYPLEDLENIVSWKWIMDTDYDQSTTAIFEGDNENITLESVNESSKTYTQITIPLTNTNTSEAIAALNTSKEISLIAELIGYDTSGNAVFIQQIEGLRLRNRIDSTGEPQQLPDAYYTKEQVDALIAGIAGANMSVEFSPDGSAWSSDSTGAYYWRFRISESGSWSTAIPIPQPASPAGAVEYSFTITEGATETEKTFTWTEIGAIGKEPVRLYQLQNDGSEVDITGNSRLQIVLKSSSVTFYWANDAFPAGTYVIRG